MRDTKLSVIARRSGGQTPLPVARVPLALTLSMSLAAFARLERGRLSEEMGDAWDVFFEDPWVYVHRSVTGVCRYAALIARGDGAHDVVSAWLNGDPSQDPRTASTALPSLTAHANELMAILLLAAGNTADESAYAVQPAVRTAVTPFGAPDAPLAAALERARRMAESIDAGPNDARLLLGAICGDVVGSSYEALGEPCFDAPLFTPNSRPTDDTILTCAVAEAVLLDGPFAPSLRRWALRHLMAGYGQGFEAWMHDPTAGPYGSSGNGSAMRVSAIGLAGWSLERTLDVATRSAECTHNHPEGIQGARAVAAAVWLARQQVSRTEIRSRVAELSGYALDRSLDRIRPDYGWSASCRDSVPEAITCFLEADDYEHALRNVLSLGGDTDTQCAIAGAIAAAYWGGVPRAIADEAVRRLPVDVMDAVNHVAFAQANTAFA